MPGASDKEDRLRGAIAEGHALERKADWWRAIVAFDKALARADVKKADKKKAG